MKSTRVADEYIALGTSEGRGWVDSWFKPGDGIETLKQIYVRRCQMTRSSNRQIVKS